MEVRDRKIRVHFKSAAHPRGGFGASIELGLAEAGPQHPYVRNRVARRKAECLSYVILRLSAAPKQILCVADEAMSTRGIRIQCQCLLALCDALGWAFRQHENETQVHVRHG